MYNEPNINNLVTFLRNQDYTDIEIKTAFQNYRKYRGRLDNFENDYHNYIDNMIKLNYSEEEIKALFLRYPRVVFHKFSLKKLRPCHINYLNSLKDNNKTEAKKDEEKYSFEFAKIKEILEKLGFSEKRIAYAFKVKASVIYMDHKILENNISFYLDSGLSKEELCILARRNIKVLEYGEYDYQEILDAAKFYGITKKSFMQMISKIIKYNSMFTIETALCFFKWSLTKNFKPIKYGKGIKKIPIIMKYSVDYLEDHYQNVIKLGYTEEEVNKMISDTISLLYMDYEALEYKIAILDEYGLSELEKHKLIYDYSAYFTMSDENIRNKLDVIKKYGLIEYLLMKPKNFIQSAELTESRAEYLLTFYPNIAYKTFCRDVFDSKKSFLRKYGRVEPNDNLFFEEKILQKK